MTDRGTDGRMQGEKQYVYRPFQWGDIIKKSLNTFENIMENGAKEQMLDFQIQSISKASKGIIHGVKG